jgi:AraC-like DNA-binding protein
MFLTFNERRSDSPFVERVWRSHSHSAGEFLSVAASHFEIAVTRHRGRTFLTLRGPETRATLADCPAEGEWLGIRFKLGALMPAFTPGDLKDRRDVTLPGATSRSFWLNGSAWEYPDFDNADTFVARLVRKGIIVRDAAVEAVFENHAGSLPIRSTQRRFLRSTGISHRTVRQIERARYATTLLKEGVSILDTVYEAGYFDQAHLTRSLKTLIGQTPVEVSRGKQQLSFLYKTAPLPRIYDAHGKTQRTQRSVMAEPGLRI